jgi:hypothetical protein
MYLRAVSDAEVTSLSDSKQISALFHWNDPAVLSLEKSWDALHWLMTAAGPQAELGFLLNGGEEVGAKRDYGRPRLLSSDFVQRLHGVLKTISDEQFWSGFDRKGFESNDVYPWIWNEPPEELREEHIYYLHKLKDLVERVAVAGGQIVMVVL